MGDLEIRSGGVVAVDTASLCAASARLDLLGQDLDRVGLPTRGRPDRRRAAHRDGLRRVACPVPGLPLHAGSPTGRARSAHGARSRRRVRGDRAARRAGGGESRGDLAAVERLDRLLVRIERENPGTGRRAAWGEWSRDAWWAGDLVAQAGMLGTTVGAGFGVGGRRARAGCGQSRRHRPRPRARHHPSGCAADRHSGCCPGARAGAAPAGRPAAGLTGRGGRPYPLERGRPGAGRALRCPTARGSSPSTSAARRRAATGARRVRQQVQSRAVQRGAIRVLRRDPRGTAREPVRGPATRSTRSATRGSAIASRLAVEGGYDTRTLVTFGSPVEAGVGDATLSVAVRLTDDPVAALQGAGSTPLWARRGVSWPSGSSIRSRRRATSPSAPITWGSTKTAAMLDASADPRMVEVREVFARLDAAASVEVAEYAATRVSASPSDAG